MRKHLRMSGQRWARIMRDANPDNPTGGGGGQSGQPGTDDAQKGQQGGQPGPDGDKGFPDNTPLAEMTPEQQAAYWKHHARKWESRANQGPTPQELEALRQKASKLDEIEQANKSELEKANDKIAEQNAKIAQYEQKELRLQALTEAGLSLDMLEFITATDAESAKDQATRLKERLGTPHTTGGVPQGYQGKGSGKDSGVAAGRELYQARKKTTTK